MAVEVTGSPPAVLFERRDHLLNLGLRRFEGRGMVVAEPDHSPERRDGLVVTGLTAEMSRGALESQSCDYLSRCIDHLRLGLIWSHWVIHPFADIPYRAAGLKRDSEHPRYDVDNR